MRRISFISTVGLFFLLSGSLSVANGPEEKVPTNLVSVSGQVTDMETGEPLAGVLIKLDESDKMIYTDFDGNFELSQIYPGRLSITTSLISYQKSKHNMEVTTEDEGVIRIKLHPFSLE